MPVEPAPTALSEHGRIVISAPPPTSADLALTERLGRQGSLTVRWLAGDQVEIVAGSCVGFVRFSGFDVQVEPKLVGGALRVLRMIDYSSGLDLLRELPTERALDASGTDLLELLCLLLDREIRHVLLDGVMRDYRSEEDALTVLRGRLRARDQLLRRYGRLDRLECTYDEYDSDNPENQLLAAAATRAARVAHGGELRWSLSNLGALLAEECRLPSTDPRHYRHRITYNRRNERYRRAHALAYLLLDHIAFDDHRGGDRRQVGAFMVDMNRVFEHFVTRLVEDALSGTGLEVDAQARLGTVIRELGTRRTYTTVRPDLVVTETSTGRRVAIDIKYKQYDLKKVAVGDVYQTFLYAFALGADGHRRAGVLFPSLSPHRHGLSITPVDGTVGATIHTRGLDVVGILDAMRTDAWEGTLDGVRHAIGELTGL